MQKREENKEVLEKEIKTEEDLCTISLKKDYEKTKGKSNKEKLRVISETNTKFLNYFVFKRR